MQLLFQATKREERNLKKMMATIWKSSPSRRKHFAAVFGRKFHAFAENSYEECPDRSIKRHYKYPYPHAEFELLRRLEPHSHDTIYVARIAKTGATLNSKPCEQCRTFLINFGIRWVVFTDECGWKKERL